MSTAGQHTKRASRGIAPRPDRHVTSRVSVHLNSSGDSHHHHPAPQAPRLSSLVPLLWLVLIPVIAALLGLLFETWLAETQYPPLNPDEGKQRYAGVFRPNPPECDDAPDLYDCLNTPVN